MDDLIGGLKAKAEEMGMAKVKEEADKRGLGGLVDQAAGFLHLGGKPAAAEAEVPAEEASPKEASSGEADEPVADEEN